MTRPTNKQIVGMAHLQEKLEKDASQAFGVNPENVGLNSGFEIKYEGEEGAIIAIKGEKSLKMFRSGIDPVSLAKEEEIIMEEIRSEGIAVDSFSLQRDNINLIILPFSDTDPNLYYDVSKDDIEGLKNHNGKCCVGRDNNTELHALLDAATQGNPDLTISLLNDGVYEANLSAEALGQRKVIDFYLSGNREDDLGDLVRCIGSGKLTEKDYVAIFMSDAVLDLFDDGYIDPEILDLPKLRSLVMSDEFGADVRHSYEDFEDQHRNPVIDCHPSP